MQMCIGVCLSRLPSPFSTQHRHNTGWLAGWLAGNQQGFNGANKPPRTSDPPPPTHPTRLTLADEGRGLVAVKVPDAWQH